MLAVNLPMVWLLVPPPRPARTRGTARLGCREVRRATPRAVLLLGGFFGLRWFITSAIAVHVLPLLTGLGLTRAEAVGIAALIGPGQVAGRILEWTIGPRVQPAGKRARRRAAVPARAHCCCCAAGVVAATGFALLYGMSNGIMTINRGTLPLALFGPEGYAPMLGWLAVPVLLGQALAPAVSAPAGGRAAGAGCVPAVRRGRGGGGAVPAAAAAAVRLRLERGDGFQRRPEELDMPALTEAIKRRLIRLAVVHHPAQAQEECRRIQPRKDLD